MLRLSGRGQFPATREQIAIQKRKRDQDEQTERRFHGWIPRGAGETSFNLESIGRQGMSSIREAELSLDQALVRTGPCSKFNVGQITSYRATIQAVFFEVCKGSPNWLENR